MSSYTDSLAALLSQDPKYTIDNILNKNIIAEHAREYDSGLLSLLYKDEKTKKLFFTKVEGSLVFKKDVFLQFISQKEFLPDSYTRFSQKIGLSFNDRGYENVVLDWPYKDCILEGGQDRNDQKRGEVFFNEVLAPDQIDAILLENKVFVNWKRYDKDGEHELDELKPGDNLIIKGNNLIVLHSLKKRFAGKVKLIYIDPPYNTGNDGFNYNDTFRHSTWLTFMKNRLEAAKDLLASDGMIFVQCDDNEQAYLKVLMDELFNFRECIVVNTSTPSGVNAVNVKRGERLFKLKEYILFYSKSGSARFNPLLVKSDYNLNYKYELKDGVLTDISKNFTSTEDFTNYCLKNPENIYSIEKNNKKAGEKTKAIIESSKGKKEVIRATNSKGEEYLAYDGGVLTPLASRVVEDNGKLYFGTLISDLWTDEVFQSNKSEGGVELPGGKKPEKLLRRIIELATNPGDIVLDYHLGSGTTAAVAHKMGRQYVGIEQLYYGENDSVIRLQNVINGDPTGISKAVNWAGGGSFVYCNIKNDANTFREKVQRASERELEKLLEEVLHSSFLSYRVDPKKVSKEEFAKLPLIDKKRVLVELVDNNTLYLNYSEIDDVAYNISAVDKKHNREFYGDKT